MKSLAIAFTGPSNSGKTTLIVKLSNLLKDKYKIAIINLHKILKVIISYRFNGRWFIIVLQSVFVSLGTICRFP